LTEIPTLRTQLSELASQFRLFECIPCAQALQEFLMQRGISGKRIKLYSGSSEDPFCNIYHEILQESISTNGKHEAIAVVIEREELIFDNLHPQGVIRAQWIQNFYCAMLDLGEAFQVTESEF
jgi:Papain fold toxin 2